MLTRLKDARKGANGREVPTWVLLTDAPVRDAQCMTNKPFPIGHGTSRTLHSQKFVPSTVFDPDSLVDATCGRCLVLGSRIGDGALQLRSLPDHQSFEMPTIIWFSL